MGHKFIYVYLALSPCVLVEKNIYIYVAGLDLSLGLEDLASALASTFWPHLTSQLSVCLSVTLFTYQYCV